MFKTVNLLKWHPFHPHHLFVIKLFFVDFFKLPWSVYEWNLFLTKNVLKQNIALDKHMSWIDRILFYFFINFDLML